MHIHRSASVPPVSKLISFHSRVRLDTGPFVLARPVHNFATPLLERAQPQMQVLKTRSFSAFPSKVLLDLSRPDFLALHQLPKSEKIDKIVHQAVKDGLFVFNKMSRGSLVQDWNQLKSSLASKSFTLPESIDDDSIATLLKLFTKQPPRSFQTSPLINNETEFYWSMVYPLFPFTHSPDKVDFDATRIDYILQQAVRPKVQTKPSEQILQDYILHTSLEDSLAALLLTTPYLHEETLVHEVGCWSGETLFHLLFYAHLQGKQVAGYLGTDIHPSALNVADTVANLLDLRAPLIQFHRANCLYPINVQSLEITHTQEIKLALRVVPVLTHADAKEFLASVRNSFPSKDSLLVLSYALPKGKTFEENQRKAKDKPHQYSSVTFEGGVSYLTLFPHPQLLPPEIKRSNPPQLLLNTYYSEESFQKLVNSCQFKILQSVTVGRYSDNERNVVVLKPI